MKSLIQFVLIPGICLSLTLSIFGQQIKNPVIKGAVNDEHLKPAKGATVNLLRSGDSAVVITLLTNDRGEFEIATVAEGNYYLKITAAGYTAYNTQSFDIKAGSVYNHGLIQIRPAIKELSTALVTASKPLIDVKPGKLVMNIENSVIATGTSVYDMLEKIPGITVDNNGSISVQGKAGILLLIDGRPTYLSNTDLANLLRSMQSDQVATIELMTTPSARYDASGNAGIINIKTKSSKQLGLNGSVLAGAGYGQYEKANTGFTLNYRSKSLNLFSNYGYNYAKRYKELSIDRLAESNSLVTAFTQNSYEVLKNANHNIKAGIDYYINKKITIGLLFTAAPSSDNRNFEGSTLISKPQLPVDSALVFQNKNNKQTRNFSYNFNFRNEFGRNKQTFNFDADYASFAARENTGYINRFYKPGNMEYRLPLLYRSQNPTDIFIQSIKADYVYPVKRGMQIEAGFKIVNVSTSNHMLFEEKMNTGNWRNDPRRSNQFRYDETVYAAYTGGSFSFKELSGQWGMRIEQTHSKGNSETTGRLVKRAYIDYFPSFEVSRTFSPKHILKLNYSKRIQRPNYQTLNPFIYYLDQYGYNVGNPYLNPQYSYNAELTYVFKSRYIFQAGVNHTKDIIAEVLLPDSLNKALYASFENLNRQQIYRLTVSSPLSITRWWRAQTNINAMYMGFKTPDLNGKQLDAGQFFTLINVNNSFIFGDGYSAELSGKYTSSMIYSTIKIKAIWFADFGVSKSFLHKKATLKVSVTDMFNSMRQRVSSVLPGFTYQLNQKPETRVLRLAFTYKFGNTNVKAQRNRATGVESERDRLNNAEK